MKRFGFNLLAAGLMVFAVQSVARGQTNQASDFNEVYDLIRTHLAGANDAELNRAAVQGLLKQLGARASLVTDRITNDAEKSGRMGQQNVFENDIAYFRIIHVEDGLAAEASRAYRQLDAMNKLKGIVLDLRYATGTDYAAAVATAELFISKSQPLLNWGNGVVSSQENSDAIKVPVAVLVNRETSGAAEALAVLFREANVGLILGGKTAGQAMITQDFPLKNGERLRIAIGEVMLGDGSGLSSQGIKPDIQVTVSEQDERAYYANAFRVIPKTNLLAGGRLSSTNQPGGTNAPSRRYLNEAELVRERKEGIRSNGTPVLLGVPEPDVPVVNDPALARALDLLKGLAVVRESHL